MVHNRVFVDTSFFKAFIDPKDEFNQKASAILKNLSKESAVLLTTNFILDETFTLVRKRCGLERARQLYEALLGSGRGFEITRVLSKDESKAWEWFWKNWSDLSFTDCVSFAIMTRLDIKRVATFDNHFKRAGFKVEN